MNVYIILATLSLVFLISLIYLISRKKHSYWRKKNVVHATPWPIFGNYAPFILLWEYSGQLVERLCRSFPKELYFGAYYGTDPVLIIQDPEMIKQVLTKDFYYFNGREISDYAMKEVVTQNVFFVHGDRWKITRQALTQLFTAAKFKKMFHMIENCAIAFEKMLDYETKISNVIEAKSVAARYTMDCVCSCAFGLQSNTMGKDETTNPFRTMGKEIFDSSTYRGFKNVFRSVWPAIFYGLRLQSFPDSIPRFFSQMLTQVFKSRENSPTSRKDFVDLMLKLKNDRCAIGDSMSNRKTGGNDQASVEIDDDYVVTQAILIFAASFESSATTLSFMLYEFAKNQDVQTKAIEEVDRYLETNGNKLSYACVTELPYLEACIYETLRLYPTFGVLTREAVENYTFPDGLQIDKGVRIHIPVYAMHRNPEYFPEPELFRPERFLPDQMRDVKSYTYFPFGEGPRMCIGRRFALMQTLPGLVTFLKKFRVELADGMPTTLPLEARSIIIKARLPGLYLTIKERDGWTDRVLAR